MDLRLDKNAVFFKDIFCLSKKKCTNGQKFHDTLSVDMKIPTRIDACCKFHENLIDLDQNTVVN